MSLRTLHWWDAYQVAGAQPDLRGWRLVDPEGNDAGTVEDLIFDSDSCEVRYLGVDVGGVRMMVPVTMAEPDVLHRQVQLRLSPAGILQGLEEVAPAVAPPLAVERRRVPGWLPWALLALLTASIAIGWAAWRVYEAPPLGAGIPPAYRNLALAYEGRVWVPVALQVPARFTDGEMIKVGRTGGHDLYANRTHGLGWGVERVPPSLETGPWGRVYVRIDDGRYVALKWRGEGTR